MALRGFYAAFRNAFTSAVVGRLLADREAAREDAFEAGPASTALIRLDGAEKAAARWMEENLKLHSGGRLGGSYSGNARGRAAGQQAGEDANLSANGVRNGGTGPTRIGSGK